MYREGSDKLALFVLCRGDLRDVSDGYALTGVGFDVMPVLRKFGQFDIPDESVIHRYALNSALAKDAFFEPVEDRFFRYEKAMSFCTKRKGQFWILLTDFQCQNGQFWGNA